MNTIKTIFTNKAPLPIGPYSQALKVNGFIFCSGQIGIDPKTNTLVEGVEKQTHQVLKNLQSILQQAGSDLNKVIKTTIFLKNIADFPKVNEIYSQYFKDHKPARSTVEVARLPKDSLIEIEAIAVL